MTTKRITYNSHKQNEKFINTDLQMETSNYVQDCARTSKPSQAKIDIRLGMIRVSLRIE